MPNIDVSDSKETTLSPALTPVFTDNNPILFKGNDAEIPGLIHAFGAWSTRTGRFAPFLKHHVVSDHGYIFIDDLAAISFLTGTKPFKDGQKAPRSPVSLSDHRQHMGCLWAVTVYLRG